MFKITQIFVSCIALQYLLIYSQVLAQCKFTNLMCHTYDKNDIEYKYCRIKAVSRNDNYARIYAKLKHVVHKANVHFTLYKRASGWRPFLYNFTVDGCKFLKNPASNPIAHLFYNILKDYTNMNHTCPFDHDIIVEKFRILNEKIRLPFPKGEYAVDTYFEVNDKLWTRVNGSCVFMGMDRS